MILGIGSDLIDIRRIEATLERFGDRFVQRLFTSVEQRKSEGRRNRAAEDERIGANLEQELEILFAADERAELERQCN